jgi:hypothetical protein
VSSNFDPYFDYESLNDEMVDDLHKALRRYYVIQQDISSSESTSKAKVKELLESFDEVTNVMTDVKRAVYTVPSMVHKAGPKKWETNPDDEDQEAVVQRCSRCGSVLSWWNEGVMGMGEDGRPRVLEEDDIPWWDEGATVAKSTNDNMMGLYEVAQGRDLDKDERECVSLAGLEEQFDA